MIDGASPSIVKIVSTGCGGTVQGSGFVVAQNLIVTNAHVVAGTSGTQVFDNSGVAHDAEVIWISPGTDLAVLRSDSLTAPPLSDVSVSASPLGEQGAILGYPNGGQFSAKPAVISGFLTAYYGIYGEDTPTRTIFSVTSDIAPGDSGGPLIGRSGNVMGIVYAQGTDTSNMALVITPHELLAAIRAGRAAASPIDIGVCASEQVQETAPPAEGNATIQVGH